MLRLLACVLLVFGLLAALPGQPPVKPPTREREAALKLFAEEFVEITPGKGKFPPRFRMGTDGVKTQQPSRIVTLSGPFALARYEVTQELYQGVVGKDPSKWKGPRNSVEMVSWSEANDFCRQATLQMRKLKLLTEDEEIRLPSEAEWEYCCRAGTTGEFSFGKADIRDYCWYAPNSPGNDPPVGVKKANPWGIHEMHGYVWEWVADPWHDNYQDAPKDERVWQARESKQHVVRGGSFNSTREQCHSASREPRDRDYRSDNLGFRCVKAKVR